MQFGGDVATISSELLVIVSFMQMELDVDVAAILEEVKTEKAADQATESIRMIQNLYLHLAEDE